MPGNPRNANLFFSGLWFKLLHHPTVRAKQSRPGPWRFLLQSAPKCQLVTALRDIQEGLGLPQALKNTWTRLASTCKNMQSSKSAGSGPQEYLGSWQLWHQQPGHEELRMNQEPGSVPNEH